MAILALVLASLACINTELKMSISHEEGGADTLSVNFTQYLTQSWITAATKVNAERAEAFKNANRATNLENLLPVRREDIGEMFGIEKYMDMGFKVTVTDTGFSASRTFPTDKDLVTEDWTVMVFQKEKHPEQTVYRVKVRLDLKDLDDSIFKLRTQTQIDPPNLTSSQNSGSSGGSDGDLFGIMGAVSAMADDEVEVELYYVQKALKQSDPIQYLIVVELPGTILIHKLDGVEAGTLNIEKNQVTLLLTEQTLMVNAGKELVFHVESVLADCRQACDPDNNLVWDGDEEGVSCNCICKKGMFALEDPPEGDTTQLKCEDCQMVCGFQNDVLVVDLEKCEPGVCACKCKPPLVSSWDGLKCITEEESWLETNLISKNGPSLEQIKVAIEAILDPDNQKDVNLMTGWKFLTSRKRELLVQRLESLGNAVDRTRLTIDKVSEMTTEEQNQRIINKKLRLKLVREMAIIKAKEKIEHRQKVHRIIMDEIGGLYWIARYIPDVISALFSTPYELAVDYVKGKLTSTVSDRIQEEALGKKVPTIKETAEKLIEDIPKKATEDTVLDYYRYKEIYDSKCGPICSEKEAEKAHYEALAELRDYLVGSIEGEYKGINRLNWAKDGDAYDHAFRKINQSVPRLKDD